MTLKEAQEAIKELKAQGETEESMLAVFYQMFIDDEIDVEELGDLCQLIGYELTDEFMNMSPEDQKTKGWEETEEETSKEEIEDAKEWDSEDEKDYDGDSNPDAKNNDNKNSKAEPEESDDEKAKKLFGF